MDFHGTHNNNDVYYAVELTRTDGFSWMGPEPNHSRFPPWVSQQTEAKNCEWDCRIYRTVRLQSEMVISGLRFNFSPRFDCLKCALVGWSILPLRTSSQPDIVYVIQCCNTSSWKTALKFDPKKSNILSCDWATQTLVWKARRGWHKLFLPWTNRAVNSTSKTFG